MPQLLPEPDSSRLSKRAPKSDILIKQYANVYLFPFSNVFHSIDTQKISRGRRAGSQGRTGKKPLSVLEGDDDNRAFIKQHIQSEIISLFSLFSSTHTTLTQHRQSSHEIYELCRNRNQSKCKKNIDFQRLKRKSDSVYRVDESTSFSQQTTFFTLPRNLANLREQINPTLFYISD